MMNSLRDEAGVAGPGPRSMPHGDEAAPDGSRRDGSRRVLFVGEAVTLAHVARPMALARKLAGRGYRPVVAVDPRFAALFADAPMETAPIASIPTRDFL